MKYRISFILTLVCLNISNSFSSQHSDFQISRLSESGRAAYQHLLKVNEFSIGGTGYAGKTSSGEQALREVLNEDAAISAFKDLLNQATPEGQLYALLGLYLKDQNAFKQEVKQYMLDRQDGKKARTMLGCLILHKPLQEVAQEIESGRYNALLKKN